MAEAVTGPDPLHEQSAPTSHWTTANIGEALPGVPTPLSWTLFGPTIERAMRGAMIATGAFKAAEWPIPPPADDPGRIVGIFYGHPVLLVDSMAMLGDRMPGTSGEQVVEGFYGTVPADMDFAPTARRYPIVAVKLTRAHFGIEKKLRKVAEETPPWHQAELARIPGISSLDEASAAFTAAAERFDYIVLLQATAAMCAVQAAFDAVAQIADRAGVEDVVGLTSGYGDVPEAAAIRDIWSTSRGEIDFEELLRRHGHHGPLEGELSATVWREDPTPLRRMVDEYAARDDSESPMELEVVRGAEREERERELLAGLPAPMRPVGRAVLNRAKTAIPLRGVAKSQFLRAFDVARASARRAGELLAEAHYIEDPEDVFYLTQDELTGDLPADLKATIAQRRTWRAEHMEVRLPTFWTGQPEPLPDEAPSDRLELDGIGVSKGVVEGVARVVTDPTFAEVEPGEILVSATTDPGWASIMFISSALVVDIGGNLSHAAVVARELGIPCVVETGDGSRVIQTGDMLRVDGGAGKVTILERAEPAPAE